MDLKEWLKYVVKVSGKQIKESNVFASLISPDALEDPKCALELGLALMMDKPIVLIVIKGAQLNDRLRRCADEIVYCDTPDDFYKAAEIIQAKLKK